MTVGLIGILSIAGPLLMDLQTAGAAARNRAMGSPYAGANAMALELAGYASSELSFTIWALAWSLAYGICAVVLLGITIAKFDRRLRGAVRKGSTFDVSRVQALAAPLTSRVVILLLGAPAPRSSRQTEEDCRANAADL
jgi:hypothetical protein